MIDFSKPHRRRNPLTGEWVLVSPHRAKRPWQGSIEGEEHTQSPDYSPGCYLCPANLRSSGEHNPRYTSTFSFVNDHASLMLDVPDASPDREELLQAQQERGVCKVLCYTPHHNKTFAQLGVDEIGAIVRMWTTEYETIGAMDHISYVQIFENKGSLMGASSPHPHGQIWANEHLPTIIEKEQHFQLEYFQTHASQLLLDYATKEQQEHKRVIIENTSFIVVVPYWATWPYETLVLPTRHVGSLSDLTQSEKTDLASILKRLTTRYDRLFNTSFPYSMGIHQKPTDMHDHPEWQFHMHFYPPLLRSSTIKKYYVGYEMMAEAQRDISPEMAAETLQNIHDTTN